jgi:hypothetical protein
MLIELKDVVLRHNDHPILEGVNFSVDDNDFMGNFGDDFELKWGLAIDPELGNKVKVTVLATGFGIEDVDGMNVHLRKHTEEETRRIAEQEEKRAEREDRRKHYYGSDGNTPQYKRHPHIFLFRPEDLDNEDVIMQVEDTPTYKRTRQMLHVSDNGQAKPAVYEIQKEDSRYFIVSAFKRLYISYDAVKDSISLSYYGEYLRN